MHVLYVLNREGLLLVRLLAHGDLVELLLTCDLMRKSESEDRGGSVA